MNIYRTRKVITATKKTAIQIIRYRNNRREIIKHIGSGKGKREISELIKRAEKEIERLTKQLSLEKEIEKELVITNYEYIGINHTFSYQILEKLFNKLNFKQLNNQILKDFTLIRIFEPASKLRSIELLHKYFGIDYKKTKVFDCIKNLNKRKNETEKLAVEFASKHYGFKYKVVFYDITTLYFEAFKEDELRKCGFSKDNKFNQPQILIALIVTDNGFPIGYEVIEGNKFEGHTLLPFIKDFREKHKPETLTVVADAAMISKTNVEKLIDNNLKYIVGARMGNLSLDLIEKISRELNQIDKATCRVKTKLGNLICQFSKNRYYKDKKEMEKQVERAKSKIKNPSKGIKLCKFVKKDGDLKYEFNENLKEKTELLLGIKGYYSNLEKKSNKYIINQYRNLWRVEKAFRIAKSDLVIRPIYHYKKESIEAHVLICFMALCISKHIELETGVSLKKFLDAIKSVTEAVLLNRFSGKTRIMKMNTPDSVSILLKDLALPH